MPKFARAEANEQEPAQIQAPVGERGMVVIKLAVPPWREDVLNVFRDGLQDWLNKAHRGELKRGDQFVLVVP
jgi:hypothetical protein